MRRFYFPCAHGIWVGLGWVWAGLFGTGMCVGILLTQFGATERHLIWLDCNELYEYDNIIDTLCARNHFAWLAWEMASSAVPNWL